MVALRLVMDVLFFILAFLAEVIGTVVGFGSSTLLMPLALFFFDFKSALVLVAVFHLFGNIGRIIFFSHWLDKRLLLVFGLPSVALAVIGALLVNYTPQEVLKLILGLFLLSFSFISLLMPSLSIKQSVENSLLGGGLSGFLAGLIGTGGALRGAFLTSFKLKKDVYIATAAGIAFAVDLTRIPIYVGSGFLNSGLYWSLPLLFIIAIIGSYVGKLLVDKLPQDSFRRVVLAAIGLVALKFIYDGVLFLSMN